MANYVIVHGAWHYGELFEDTAAPIRAAGHKVWLPTIAGQGPGDSKKTGLEEAIQSIVDYLAEQDLNDVILAGHSYGGMIITGVADRIPERIRRLVYWNAFVPNNGESVIDMLPPQFEPLFEELLQPDGSFELPFQIWREAMINDAPLALAESTYEKLVPQPFKTFSDAIKLDTDPAEMSLPKSYINCTEDTAIPQSAGWHPRLSEKLGIFRLIQCPGSHELCFTNPQLLAQKIMEAGRD